MEMIVTEFKVGDKIEFVEPHGTWAKKGDTAVVTRDAHFSLGDTYVFYKLDKDGKLGDCFARRVKKVDPFKFSDIQVGDKIRRTRKYPTGALEVREGTVGNRGGDWVGQGNFILAYASDDANEQVTLELLERPEPKHWAEEKPVGSIALHTPKSKVGADNRKRLRKVDENRWEVLYFMDQKPQFYTNTNLKQTFASLDPADLEWIR